MTYLRALFADHLLVLLAVVYVLLLAALKAAPADVEYEVTFTLLFIAAEVLAAAVWWRVVRVFMARKVGGR